MACLVRQSLSGQAPLYLADDCRLVSDSTRRSLLSADVSTCVVPRTLSSYGDRTFAAAGPRLWNSLPVQLRQQTSLLRYLRTLSTLSVLGVGSPMKVHGAGVSGALPVSPMSIRSARRSIGRRGVARSLCTTWRRGFWAQCTTTWRRAVLCSAFDRLTSRSREDVDWQHFPRRNSSPKILNQLICFHVFEGG